MANISRTGIHQGDLVTLLKLIKTDFNGICTKLDSDTLVGKATYNSLFALDRPGGEIESQGTGIGNADKIEFIDEVFTKYNLLIAQLNGDSGVGDSDYAELTAVVGENKTIFAGMNQTDLITALQTVITGIATLTAKLDSDTGVSDTDYAATYDVADTVDDSGQ